MRTGRSLAVIVLAAAALVMGSNRTGAQEQQPPDLRMLLNLDLFRPHPPDANSGGAGKSSNNSMLDQIRALKAMGYLRGNPQGSDDAHEPDDGGDSVSPVSGAGATTSNMPPKDSEGQP